MGECRKENPQCPCGYYADVWCPATSGNCGCSWLPNDDGHDQGGCAKCCRDAYPRSVWTWPAIARAAFEPLVPSAVASEGLAARSAWGTKCTFFEDSTSDLWTKVCADDLVTTA